MTQGDIVSTVLLDLEDFFSELNDDAESAETWGDFARVAKEGNSITVLHETFDLGVRITVERLSTR